MTEPASQFLKRKETGFAAFHFPCFFIWALDIFVGFGSYKDQEVKQLKVIL